MNRACRQHSIKKSYHSFITIIIVIVIVIVIIIILLGTDWIFECIMQAIGLSLRSAALGNGYQAVDAWLAPMHNEREYDAALDRVRRYFTRKIGAAESGMAQSSKASVNREECIKAWQKKINDLKGMRTKVWRHARGAWIQGTYPKPISDAAWDFFGEIIDKGDKRAGVIQYDVLPSVQRNRATEIAFNQFKEMALRARVGFTNAAASGSDAATAPSASAMTVADADKFQ